MEPAGHRVRPSHMGGRLTAAALLVACALGSVACGSRSPGEDHPSAGSSDGSSSGSSGSCAGDPAAFSVGRTVASVDLDGDGHADVVRLTGASQECPARVVAEIAGTVVGAEVSGRPASAFGVQLQGRRGRLLVTREDHPRGGYQLHVFALGGGALAELQDADRPLVPFVATDVRPLPATVDCRGGSVVVTTAVARPGGRWDVRSTSYAVDGSTASRTASRVVASGLGSVQADRRLPAGAAVFPSCRA